MSVENKSLSRQNLFEKQDPTLNFIQQVSLNEFAVGLEVCFR